MTGTPTVLTHPVTGEEYPAPPGADIVTCGECRRSWDDSLPTSVTPAPAARCPFEYDHDGNDEYSAEDEKWRFTVMQGQIQVSDIRLIGSGPDHAAFEISTTQKFPRVASFAGWGLNLMPSERTYPDSLSLELPEWTRVIWPRRLRGWTLIVEPFGKYSVSLALIRPDPVYRACPVTEITEDAAVEAIKKGLF